MAVPVETFTKQHSKTPVGLEREGWIRAQRGVTGIEGQESSEALLEGSAKQNSLSCTVGKGGHSLLIPRSHSNYFTTETNQLTNPIGLN